MSGWQESANPPAEIFFRENRPLAISHLAEHSLQDIPRPSDVLGQAPDSYLVRIGRRAMACQFEVLLNAGQYPQGTEQAIAALDLVDVLEAQMTVYRDDSEISRLNRTAAYGSVEVEPQLFDLLQRAVAIHAETGGAYDITAGPLTRVWGFYRRSGSVPSPADLSAALSRVGSQHLRFDRERHAVQFDIDGLEINLGSIGKGYALDRSADLLSAAGIQHFLLHGGQSSVLSRGSQGDGDGWIVGLRHPDRADKRLAEIRLRNKALGTSGSGTQFFLHGGKRFGHILDPRTGMPADKVLSATVVAPTAAEADALATAFYVMGVEPALEYCTAHPHVAVIIVSRSAGHAVQVVSAGFSDGELSVLQDEES